MATALRVGKWKEALGGTLGIWVRGVCLSVGVLVPFALGLFEASERLGLNTQFELRGTIPPKSPIVIVSIDEDSIDELSYEFQLAWPWPRSIHARLLDIVSTGKPAVVGLDILFDERSSYGQEDDLALAEAVGRAGNVILAAALTVVDDPSYKKEDLNPPITIIRKQAAGYGPVNALIDKDAFVRMAEVKRTYQDKELPYFNLLIYRKALEAGIPAQPLGDSPFRINYRGGPKTFTTVPYHRVLYEEVPPELFAGKIVLVGATSPVLHDRYPTPFASEEGLPGVEIHANALETLLQGIPIARLPWPLMMAFILLGSVLGVWLATRFQPQYALVAVIAVAALYVGAGFASLVLARVWVDVYSVPVALLLGHGATVIENFIREQREKRRLARFFSPTVVKEIVRHRSDEALGSTRRRITVLFSDIRGFTSLSEKLPPEKVVEILTEYLTELTEVVFRNGGMVDKYVGDCIMALYGVPFDDPDHATKAIRTALEFQERTEALSVKCEASHGMQLKNGVGINTGDAVVGTMGSRQRLEYTAIGDTVNLAARLESITKEYRSSIIISEFTYQETRGRFRTRYLGPVRVKGKEIPVRIYAVVEPAEVNVRKEPRVALETDVALTYGENEVLVTLGDLSRGGISVHARDKELPRETSAALRMDLGQSVHLHLDLPAAAHSIKAKGEVAWSVEDKAGIRFMELENGGAAIIEEFVNRWVPASQSK